MTIAPSSVRTAVFALARSCAADHERRGEADPGDERGGGEAEAAPAAAGVTASAAALGSVSRSRSMWAISSSFSSVSRPAGRSRSWGMYVLCHCLLLHCSGTLDRASSPLCVRACRRVPLQLRQPGPGAGEAATGRCPRGRRAPRPPPGRSAPTRRTARAPPGRGRGSCSTSASTRRICRSSARRPATSSAGSGSGAGPGSRASAARCRRSDRRWLRRRLLATPSSHGRADSPIGRTSCRRRHASTNTADVSSSASAQLAVRRKQWL